MADAIVTDLDNTLIGSNDEPIQPILNLLLDAHQRGDRVIVVSGRQLNRLDETRAWLDEHGLEIPNEDIHLSDFPVGPNASESFKIFKAKKLLADGVNISAWYENDAMTRRRLKSLGINALDPANVRAVSPTTPGAPVPTSFGVRQTMQAPQAMRDAAHDGLKFYAMGRAGDGLTAQTVREARDMVKGIVTLDKWKRIGAWIARHRVDWEGVAKNSDPKDSAFPGAGAVAAYLWGVDPTESGSADEVLKWVKQALSDGTEENSMSAAIETRDIGEDVAAEGATAVSLADYLKRLLGDVFTFYTTAHGFHWNVTGTTFAQFHELFEEIYEDVYSSIDPIAENVRKLDDFPVFRLPDLIAVRAVEDVDVVAGDGVVLVDALLDQNDGVLGCLNEAFALASAQNQQGIANFLAERIDMHQKWRWQLRATLGSYVKVEDAEPAGEDEPADEMVPRALDVAKMASLYSKKGA